MFFVRCLLISLSSSISVALSHGCRLHCTRGEFLMRAMCVSALYVALFFVAFIWLKASFFLSFHTCVKLRANERANVAASNAIETNLIIVFLLSSSSSSSAIEYPLNMRQFRCIHFVIIVLLCTFYSRNEFKRIHLIMRLVERRRRRVCAPLSSHYFRAFFFWFVFLEFLRV